MTDQARPWLEPGETIVAATWGATSVVAWLLGSTQRRIAAVTDRNVHVFSSSIHRRARRPRGLVATHRRGSQPVRLQGLTLRVADERMVVHVHQRERAAEVARLAAEPATTDGPAPGRAESPGAAPLRVAPAHGRPLEIDGLVRRFGQRVALDHLTFTVAPGRIFGFLGPNGAGKTTTMRIVLGIDRPDEGAVRWGGKPVDEASRLRFGYMPEQRGLYPKMRLRDQLVYLARLHRLDAEEADASVDWWLARLGVADRATDRLDRLSHGNQQRVQLAAALVHNPDLLVLDEPFSGLDPIGVQAMVEVLRERVQQGATVVFSSHQLDLVEDVCDDVAVINRGRVVLAGEVRALKAAGTRALVVEVAGAPPGWLGDLAATGVTDDGRGRLRMELDGLDPQVVLDRARSAGRVERFELEEPSLSELFLKAVSDG